MNIWVHVLVSSILALLLYPLFNWIVIFIFIGGVLIDIDHYFWYAYRFKNINLYKSYKYYIKKQEKSQVLENVGILLIFHSIEFLLIVVFLSFYFKFMILFTIGLLSHYTLDAIFLYNVAGRFIATPSIISWIIKNKNQKNFL